MKEKITSVIQPEDDYLFGLWVVWTLGGLVLRTIKNPAYILYKRGFDYFFLAVAIRSSVRSLSRSKIGFKYLPVYDFFERAIFSGVPVAII